MQTLKLADDLMPYVLDGNKRVTVRKGKRDIVEGKLLLEATDGTQPSMIVDVKRVVVRPLWNVPLWAVHGEGLTGWDDLMECLVRFYPDVTEDTEVTSIEFEFVSLFGDLPYQKAV